jgi:hypothetical protein
LRHLEPEPWGARITRARETAGFTIREVADTLFPHVSRSTLVRLEDLAEPPADRKNRGRAALLLLLYGFDLSDFGLCEADLPPAIDREAVRRLLTKWYRHTLAAA